MSPTTITLIITVLMAILLVTGKYPFGLVTMASAFALILFGVLDLPTAMSGMTNGTVIMLAAMFCLSAALQKTNVPYYLNRLLSKVDGKNNTLIVLASIAVMMIMEIFMPFMVCIVLIASVIQALPKDSEVKLSRMLLPLMIIGCVWELTVPIGLGATLDFSSNLFVENIVTDPNQLLKLGNIFLGKIAPVVASVIYGLFIWKRLPKTDVQMDLGQVKEAQKSNLPQWKQYLVYASFIIVILSLIFSSFVGPLMFVIPGVCVIVLGFTGCMSKQEIISTVANDNIWLLVGIQAVTNALTNTGATQQIGTALLPLITWTDNSFIILVIIGIFTALLTTFLSNQGTKAVITPLVATLALSAGLNPRAMMVTVAICSSFAFSFPSGSPNSALVYGMAQYNPIKMLKYNIPILIIMCVVTAAATSILFPL